MLEKHWLVFYTKARWEKKVFEYLIKFGYEPYLPLVKELRQWSDRKKKVEAPLFRSYIFVHSTFDQINEIVKIPGIAWSLRNDNKPAFLREEEKTIIQKTLESGYVISEVGSEIFDRGDKVKVSEGPLKGIEGEILDSEKGNVIIRVESLDKAMKVMIPDGLLFKIVNE